MSWGGIFPLHTANKEASERARVGEGRGPQACLCPGNAGGLGQGTRTRTEPWKHETALRASPGILTSHSQSKGILLLKKTLPLVPAAMRSCTQRVRSASVSPGNQHTGRHSTGLGSREPASLVCCSLLGDLNNDILVPRAPVLFLSLDKTVDACRAHILCVTSSWEPSCVVLSE